MFTVKDTLRSVWNNKISRYSLGLSTSITASVISTAVSPNDSDFFSLQTSLGILFSGFLFFESLVATTSTLYATKYSKEKFHENMKVPFNLIMYYHNDMGYCRRVGFEMAAKDLGFEIPDNDPESMLRLLYSNVKMPNDITGYIHEASSSIAQELGLEKTLDIFIETTGLDVDFTFDEMGKISGFIAKTPRTYDPLEIN